MPQIRDSGSNYQFYDKKINPKIKRSGFNLNRIRQTTADFGVLQPVLKQYAMPNSDLTFQHEMALTAINPPAVPLGSRQRIFYHLYKVTFQQMWPKWGTFMSKGRNGNTVIPLPKIRFVLDKGVFTSALTALGNPVAPSNGTYTQKMAFVNHLLDVAGCFGPNCLTTFLQIPCPEDLKKDLLACVVAGNFNSFTTRSYDYSAFPFFAYLSVWRNFYVNPNLDVNNEYLFPADENDFALVKSDGDDDIFYASIADFQRRNPGVDSKAPATNLDFGYFKYRNFVDDYFTSSLPWPMRGDIPEVLIGENQELTIPVTGLDEVRYVDAGVYEPFDATIGGTSAGDSSTDIDYNGYTMPTVGVKPFRVGPSAPYDNVTDAVNANLGVIMHPYKAVSSSGTAGSSNVVFEAEAKSAYAFTDSYPSLKTRFQFASSFTWEMIRNLSISTIIQEKMARTNGSYVEFVKTFFDQQPKNYSNNIPEYIGGDLQPILYRQVVQQSESGNTPLGTIGGKGMASSEGYLGKAHFDDFGLVLGLISIMPDVYYSQGLHRIEMYEVQEDFPLPERAELGMQGVFNGEIFHTGTPAKDVELFGYQNRFDEWRYAENELSGEVMNPGSYAYFPFTQSRYFLQKPELSKEFISSKDNIRRDYLSTVDEVPFFVQVANRIRVVQPLPYKAIPVGLK